MAESWVEEPPNPQIHGGSSHLPTPLRAGSPGATIQNFGPASQFTGGDPVTYFGGKKWKFWMPLHKELLLLATPEIRLYGSAFPGRQTFFAACSLILFLWPLVQKLDA
eukprot:g2796.t1